MRGIALAIVGLGILFFHIEWIKDRDKKANEAGKHICLLWFAATFICIIMGL